MASRKNAMDTIRRLVEFYGDVESTPIDALAQALGMDEKEARDLLTEFELLPPRRRRGRPRKSVLAPPPTTAPTVEPEVKPKRKWNEIDPIEIIRWAMLVIAIPALFLSGWFSVDTLSTMLPAPIDLIAGVTLVGFATFAFEGAVVYRRAKNKIWILLGILWIILLSFSMSAILQSLYNNYLDAKEIKTTSQATLQVDVKQYNDLEEKIDKLEEDKNRILENIKPYKATMQELDTLEEQNQNRTRFTEAVKLVTASEVNIKTIDTDIDKNKKEQDTILARNPEVIMQTEKQVRLTFYGLVGKIFNVDEDFMTFIIQAIPALALDLIASVSLFVFLFPNKKEE